MDSSQGVYMDTDAVRRIARTFAAVGYTLGGIGRILEGLMNKLKSTAFVGAVGGAAVEAFIQTIKPQIDMVTEKCHELHRDLNTSVQAYARGDREGATRFH